VTVVAEPVDAKTQADHARALNAEMGQLRQNQYLLNCILKTSLSGVVVLQTLRNAGRAVEDYEIQRINPAGQEMLGRSESMLIGKKLCEAVPCLAGHSVLEDLATVITSGLPLEKQYQVQRQWMQLAVVPLGDGVAVTFTDTTARHKAEAKLKHVAYHDELTGLPNRKMLMDRVENSLNRARRFSDHRFALLFLDFDRFKLVNDTLGHDVGDLLLNGIAHRLRENIREVDSAALAGEGHVSARLGGDEFVVLLDGVKGIEDATAVARRLLEAFNVPYDLDGHRVTSTASIGVVISGPQYTTVDELLRDADTAMYQAKNAGKARYVVFDQHMHEALVAQGRLENDLRQAVANEDFALVYEPIVDLNTGMAAGFEALIRWDHPQRGEVSPAEFLAMAQELNLVVCMGEWVIKRACEQLARWRSMGHNDMFVNVNLSRAQLYDGDLAELIAQQIQTHGFEPSALRLEITETMMVDDGVPLTEALEKLKALGVKLALDNFGTGHGSLNMLQDLPLDILKIDRTFIEGAGQAVRRYGAIIATITELAQNLGMQVIAQGIERSEQVTLLRGLHCNYAQGWLFSRAVDADGAADIVGGERQLGEAA